MTDHGFKYKVNESVIYVRNRPKSLSTNGEDRDEKSAVADESDAYLSVTDTFCVAPPGKIFVWFPWNEGRNPIPEMYYATNRVLNWWVHYQKIPRIQLFCDGGSHRSVTVFGAFLRTYHNKDAKEIVEKRESVNNYLSYVSDPLDYIDSYLREFPADALLFKSMREDYLGRLDGHSGDIYRQVKARYGDK